MEISKKIWIIMDRNRKVIAKGIPRNRNLCLIDNPKDQKRILTYRSKKSAESAFRVSGFYDETNGYLYNEYNYGWSPINREYNNNLEEFLEAVEAELIIKI